MEESRAPLEGTVAAVTMMVMAEEMAVASTAVGEMEEAVSAGEMVAEVVEMVVAGEDRDGFGVVTPRRWSGCYHAYGALNEREEG